MSIRHLAVFSDLLFSFSPVIARSRTRPWQSVRIDEGRFHLICSFHSPVIARLARAAQPLAALPPYGCGVPPAGAICPSQVWELYRMTRNPSSLSFPPDAVRQGICPSLILDLYRIIGKSPILTGTDCPHNAGNDRLGDIVAFSVKCPMTKRTDCHCLLRKPRNDAVYGNCAFRIHFPFPY